MKREKEAKNFVVDSNNLQTFERVAKVTGVPQRTVKRTAIEANGQPKIKKFFSSRKIIAKVASKSTVDQFDEEIICKVIYKLTTIHKKNHLKQEGKLIISSHSEKTLFLLAKDEG